MKLHKAIQLTNAMIHKMNAAPSAITKTFSMNIENKTRSIELSKQLVSGGPTKHKHNTSQCTRYTWMNQG